MSEMLGLATWQIIMIVVGVGLIVGAVVMKKMRG